MTTAQVKTYRAENNVSDHAAVKKATVAKAAGLTPKVVFSELLLFALMIPTETLPTFLGTTVSIMRYLAFFWSLLLVLPNCNAYLVDTLPICSLFAIMLISTLINENGFYECLRYIYSSFSGIIIAKHVLIHRRYKGIGFIARCMTFLIVLQFISSLMILYFTNYSDTYDVERITYFLGTRVIFSDIYIFTLTLNAILRHLQKDRIAGASWFLTVLVGIHFIVLDRNPAVIATIIIWLSIILFSKVIHSRHIWKTLIVISILFSIGFNFILINIPLVSLAVEKVFSESSAINISSFVWPQAISRLSGFHWIFGYGFNNGLLFHLDNDALVESAHSQYLEILYRFGLLGCIAYISILVNQFNQSLLIKDYAIRSLIIACTIYIIIMGIVNTTYYSIYIYIFYIVILHQSLAFRPRTTVQRVSEEPSPPFEESDDSVALQNGDRYQGNGLNGVRPNLHPSSPCIRCR